MLFALFGFFCLWLGFVVGFLCICLFVCCNFLFVLFCFLVDACLLGVYIQSVPRGQIFLRNLTCSHIEISVADHVFCYLTVCDRLVGLVVKAPAFIAADPEVDSPLQLGFSGSSHTSDKNVHSSGYPAEAPGVVGSVLGLGGPGVSILVCLLVA